MNSRYFITSLLCGCSFLLNGQTPLSVADFLEKSVREMMPFSTNREITSRFSPNWVEGVDIRTETDDFDIERQRFQLRVKPNTPKIRQAQSALHDLYTEQAAIEMQLLQRDFIELAYEQLIDSYQSIQEIALKEQLLSVVSDKEKVLFRLAQLSSELPKDWLAAKRERTNLEVAIEQEYQQAAQLMIPPINWKTLLPISQVQAVINADSTRSFFQTQAIFDVESALIDGEAQLEQAEQKRYLDFLQLEYNGSNNAILAEKLSVGLAFQLPFSSNRALKMEELAIEKALLEREKAAKMELNTLKLMRVRKKINRLVSNLNVAKDKHEEQARVLTQLVQKNSQRDDANPLFALYEKEQDLQHQLDFLKMEVEIYQEYLDYLKLTEQLYQMPYRHFSAY
ncbi:MAG: hypothetical protein AAF960_19650 [Bacteroidota bacterium]